MTDDRCDLLCLNLEVAEALRRNRLPLEAVERSADQAKALGDPTRLALAAILADADELCVCDLSWISERAENLVSHHLRLLRSARLVERRRDGKLVIYSLTERGHSLLSAALADRVGV